MKTLYLNRHAKSNWENKAISDFARPLNQRGKNDAPFMGKLLRDKVTKPDLIITSPAVRAKATAYTIADYFGIEQENILENEIIYEASVTDLLNFIKQQPNEKEIVMLFGHNPTFTRLANFLTDSYIDNIPTCGFVKIDLEINIWSETAEAKGKLLLFEYPKKYKK